MGRFLSALLLAAACFYIASLYENPGIALLGCVQVILAFLALGYLLYERKGLQVVLDRMPLMMDQKEPVCLRVRAGYRYRGCYGRIRVQMAVRREGGGRARRQWLSGEDIARGTVQQAGPAGQRRLSGFLSLAEPGGYEVRLRKARIYDMTGLFCMDCRRAVRTESAVMVVLPKIYPMGIQLSQTVRNFAGDAEVYDSLRSGSDASETLNLRPFQDGDKLRNIHWKLSAKADELLVRENSMPRGCPVAVLVETGDAPETRLQCAASLSFCLMDRECPHYVAWYSGDTQDLVRARVDDEESYYEALLCLVRERSPGNMPDIRERYREKYSGEPLLYCIRVGDGPSLQVDNREILRLKASALERELGALELLL
ncbi:MAG: DUF58 domain-containing protein [Lachnospiraceae bacterium]|nr:DUF58 domain-containing protein [Lachnospiraceae bacterium]